MLKIAKQQKRSFFMKLSLFLSVMNTCVSIGQPLDGLGYSELFTFSPKANLQPVSSFVESC
jgi:hypothetical protein